MMKEKTSHLVCFYEGYHIVAVPQNVQTGWERVGDVVKEVGFDSTVSTGTS